MTITFSAPATSRAEGVRIVFGPMKIFSPRVTARRTSPSVTNGETFAGGRGGFAAAPAGVGADAVPDAAWLRARDSEMSNHVLHGVSDCRAVGNIGGARRLRGFVCRFHCASLSACGFCRYRCRCWRVHPFCCGNGTMFNRARFPRHSPKIHQMLWTNIIRSYVSAERAAAERHRRK